MSGLTRRVIGAVAMDAPLTFQLLLGRSFTAAFERHVD